MNVLVEVRPLWTVYKLTFRPDVKNFVKMKREKRNTRIFSTEVPRGRFNSNKA